MTTPTPIKIDELKVGALFASYTSDFELSTRRILVVVSKLDDTTAEVIACESSGMFSNPGERLSFPLRKIKEGANLYRLTEEERNQVEGILSRQIELTEDKISEMTNYLSALQTALQ